MSKKNRRFTPSISAQPARTEFNPDYSSVKKDLTRIGVLAATFFVALIVLSFFIK